MVSRYPAQIDDNVTLPVVADNSTLVRASILNELRAAIIAIESSLGVNPASVYGTVRERLAVLDATLSSLVTEGDVMTIAGDLDGDTISQVVVGLQGNPISTTDPADGYALIWDGNAWGPSQIDCSNSNTITGILAEDNGGTGLSTLGVGVANFLGTPSSSNLAAAITDETGTGSVVFATSPTIDTPTFKTLVKVNNPADTFAYTITPAAIAAERTLNLPLLTGTDTIVTEAFTQTLTNKTLTSPVLAAPSITGTVTYQGTKLRILSIPGEAQTTTATTVVIATFTMIDETSCKVDFTAGMKAVGAVAKAGGWTGSATYYRTSAGAPTITNGTPNYGTAEETTAGDNVEFNISGNDIQILATAADGDDRNWTCEFRVAETLAT